MEIVDSDVGVEELARLFESHYPLILRTAGRYAPCSGLSSDIAQQSFIVFMRGVQEKKWDIREDVAPLLREIVKRVAMKLWEQEKKNTPAHLRRIGERILLAAEQAGPNLQEPVRRRLDLLKVCMDKLSRKSRSLLERYYIQGLSAEEIGMEDDKKAPAVRQALCRIRGKLRRCMEQARRREGGL